MTGSSRRNPPRKPAGTCASRSSDRRRVGLPRVPFSKPWRMTFSNMVSGGITRCGRRSRLQSLAAALDHADPAAQAGGGVDRGFFVRRKSRPRRSAACSTPPCTRRRRCTRSRGASSSCRTARSCAAVRQGQGADPEPGGTRPPARRRGAPFPAAGQRLRPRGDPDRDLREGPRPVRRRGLLAGRGEPDADRVGRWDWEPA